MVLAVVHLTMVHGIMVHRLCTLVGRLIGLRCGMTAMILRSGRGREHRRGQQQGNSGHRDKSFNHGVANAIRRRGFIGFLKDQPSRGGGGSVPLSRAMVMVGEAKLFSTVRMVIDSVDPVGIVPANNCKQHLSPCALPT